MYETRLSGFYETGLDARLQKLEVTCLVITSCTTSICVDSTVRDAMFTDYCPVVAADCMSEPIGQGWPRPSIWIGCPISASRSPPCGSAPSDVMTVGGRTAW